VDWTTQVRNHKKSFFDLVDLINATTILQAAGVGASTGTDFSSAGSQI